MDHKGWCDQLARRRIIHEEEVEEVKDKKPAFKPTKFDEKEFLQTEMRSAKMIYISLGIALVAGLVSFGLMRIFHSLDTGLHFIIPLASPVGFAFLVIYLFKRFGIDIKELEWKKWLENGFMYVLAWFVVWMLSMNPPISDFSDPQIEEPLLELKTIEGKNYTYFMGTLYINDATADGYKPSVDIEGVTQAYVYVPISDNDKVDKWDIDVQQKVSSEWRSVEDPESVGIYIGKNFTFEPREDLKDIVSDKWIQRESDVWDGHLWTVLLEISEVKNSTLNTGGDLEIKLTYKVWDARNNYSEFEYDFKVGL
jgi:hypothetical protein